MKEEEEKAIKIIEELLQSEEPICEYMLKHQEVEAMRKLLNLIETQKAEIEELREYKKISELTKISCCTAQNCEALNNAIREGLENNKLKEEIEKRDKMIDLMIDTILKNDDNYWHLFDANKKAVEEYFSKLAEEEK